MYLTNTSYKDNMSKLTFFNKENPQAPIGTLEWFLMAIAMYIPFVNICLLIIWALAGANNNRKNYARAYLIYIAIWFGIIFIGNFIVALLVLKGIDLGPLTDYILNPHSYT